MKINSHNEWDKLKEIIVGSAQSQACFMFSGSNSGGMPESVLSEAMKVARQAYPQSLLDEINEDLEELCTVAKTFGAVARRPTTAHLSTIFTTPYFSGRGESVYNMRDLHLVVGNSVIESSSQERHRYFEAMGLYDIWYQYFKEGCRWIAAPKPRLAGDHMVAYYEGEKTAYDDGQRYIRLTEDEILFEAANTVRMGRDLLYLVSRSGNYLGARWLQSILGEDYRVHTTEKIYKSSHIDSTVLCLRPGLVLLNGERVNEQNTPAILATWDKIYFNDIIPTPSDVIEFHEKHRKPVHHQLQSMGIQSNIDSVSSKWIGMNVLSLDPSTVVIDKRQVPLMKVLEKHRITPVPISFRHSYFMGGIHCSTLDTVRESRLESYFD